jgi:hypothetical protein
LGGVEVLAVKTCWLELSTEVVLALWVLVEVVEILVGDVPRVVVVMEASAACWGYISIIHF